MSWLGKVFPSVGFLERQVEELRVVNQRLTDQLLKATGNEAIYDVQPVASDTSSRSFGISAGQRPVKTRQTMNEYLRRLEAEEEKLLQEEMIGLVKADRAND